MRRWERGFGRGTYLLGATAVALLATVGIANADGMAKARGAPPPAYSPMSWSGVYFGVHSGYAWADIDSRFVPGPNSDSVDHDVQVAGGQIGIQHQWNNIVLGVEANLSVAFQDDFGGSVTCPNIARTCQKRFDDVLSVGPRIGWANGKYMPYITGGYANAAFSHNSYDTATLANPLFGRERVNGWYLGVGLDWAIVQDWTVGLEYRHYDFDSASLQSYAPGGALSDLRTIDPSLDTVTMRVSWKWGRPDRGPAPLK